MTFELNQKTPLKIKNKETGETLEITLKEKSHEKISEKSFKEDTEDWKANFTGEAPNGEKITCTVTYPLDSYSTHIEVDAVSVSITPLFEIAQEPDFEFVRVTDEEG
jgi:hypothetical protein